MGGSLSDRAHEGSAERQRRSSERPPHLAFVISHCPGLAVLLMSYLGPVELDVDFPPELKKLLVARFRFC